MVNIDSANPARLARFYAAALGWESTYSDDSYGMVEGNGIKIGFGRVEGFPPAQWPDEAGVKRFQLDLQVGDLDEAAERPRAIGASRAGFQPGAGRWRVLFDPDGQPFCLSPRSAAVP
ncbi:MAG: hypothetical protein JWM85_1807 [Acidimicrobiaceae bacterium]|nr:hypothetical protein [Acidimicrobiaceae bacterium]